MDQTMPHIPLMFSILFQGPSPSKDGGDKEGNSSVVNVVVKKKEEKKELKPEPVAEPEETEEKVNGKEDNFLSRDCYLA